MFLQKTPVAYARAGRELADPLTSNPQSRDGTMENCGLKAEILYVFKLVCAKIIPIAEKKLLRGTKWSDARPHSWR